MTKLRGKKGTGTQGTKKIRPFLSKEEKMFRRRVISWIIDYGILLGFLYLYGFVAVFLQNRLDEEILDRTVYPIALVVLVVFYVGLLFKDVINKRSFGKKLCI